MDFALVDVTFFIISMALFLIILDGHICSVILDGIAARIVGYVNVTLHIGMFVCLMFSRVPLEFLVLTFMASVFSYCLAFYVRYRIDMKREAASASQDAPPIAADEAVLTATDAPESAKTEAQDDTVVDDEPRDDSTDACDASGSDGEAGLGTEIMTGRDEAV